MIGDSQKGTVAYNHLSLTRSVTKGSDTLKYTYDATGRRIKRQFNNETARHYIDGVEYEGGTLKFISTEYGRIRRENGSWHYDYFLKDHLGNVRVMLEAPTSSAQSNTILYMATMEESKAATEDTYFANLDETRADRPYNYPDKNLLNAKLAKVPGKSKGPSILLPVLAGDTISISAKAFYNMDNTLPGKSIDIVPVVGSAIATLTSPVSGIAGEVTQLAADLGTEASQSVVLRPALQDDDSQKEVKPQSGINFVLYNNGMKVVEANTGVMLVDDRINEIQTLASDRIVIKEAGFIEIFINNDAQTPVYYDNLIVTQSAGRVIEVNAYYPYGMIIPALSIMATPDKWNGYKYSTKELETALNLGWYNFGNRMQDPVIGRFMVPDRFAEKYYHLSPYSYTANNPINIIDIRGDSAWSIIRAWNKDDIKGFASFASDRLKDYVGTKMSCSDLALTVLVEYASQNGLELQLTSADGKTSFDSNSDDYNSVGDFLNGTRNAEGKRVPGALSLSVANGDIQANTFSINNTERQPGDMVILTQPAGHVMSYSSRSTNELIYGSQDADYNPIAVKGNGDRWTFNDYDGSGRPLRRYPDKSHVNRWNVLNITPRSATPKPLVPIPVRL
jgi:RHS repeat-associated protein